MARGLRLWLAVVALGCAAALGITRVWTGAVRRTIAGYARPDSTEATYTSLSREAVQVATAIQRIRLSRAIQDTVQQGDVDSLIVLGPNLPLSAANRDTVRKARSLLGPGDTVAIAVAAARWRRPDDGNRYLWYTESQGVDYLLPDGGPCQVAVFVPGGPATPGTFDRLVNADDLLGPCYWVARYGPPSDSILAWLPAAGGPIARAVTPSKEAPAGRVLNRLEAACRRGDANACETAIGPLALASILRVPPPEMAGLLLYSRTDPRAPFSGVGAHILADIEAEVGADRFAAFWHADQPAEAALSDALGRPLGEWVADWAAARFPEPARAGPGVGDILLTLLVIGILAWIGLLMGAKGRPVPGRDPER